MAFVSSFAGSALRARSNVRSRNGPQMNAEEANTAADKVQVEVVGAETTAAAKNVNQETVATVGAMPMPQQPAQNIATAASGLAAALGALILGKRAFKKDKSAEVETVTEMKADAAAGGNGAEQKGGLGLGSLIPTKSERKKLIPLGLMFFVILFNYTILRDTKDVLVVTAAGAEIIPFLKTYCNLPGAILFTIAYSKLSNYMSREALFYACILPFVAFFFLFAFYMYPNLAALHPIAWTDQIAASLPANFAAPLAIIKNWTFAVFYTLAELWGSVVVSLLFWGFANEVTTVDEAKKYYPLFGLGANVALIFSGQYVRYVSDIRRNLPAGVDGWGLSLKYLMAMVAFGGLVIAGCYFYVSRFVLTAPTVFKPGAQKKTKVKTKLGVRESAKYLASSRYIRDLAMLVIAYGMSINIVEVTWKGRLRQAFPDPNDYSTFMGNFSTATGSVTFVMMIIGRFIFRKFGWGVAATITPTVLGFTGLTFFGLLLFSGQVSPLIASIGTTPLMAAVLVGAAQNVLSKSSKYSLFDPCKEMAYIPLDAEQKSKGKAAVDVIGNPLGKSGGSFIQQGLIFSMGSLAASTPYLAAILAVIVVMWLVAARSLDRQFADAMRSSEAAEAALASEVKTEAKAAESA
eukprot:CAMPEP_0198722764 /NCGR_PEP_ID=MMETSP1475-20131203/351_1 /TAXON_ID= ORGANISM="Unidentified sp., Strain CCMP1999" /NCGR_SAMPLE_ID=MMETSP1475 /ASSEMBLY_ACC=CAM_ASM_001111 /LENGTH=632 /DNA_ID=CAMNT_0044483685 /DNA_START=137 /DNA_END=2035 /DNA_ORIENTATION=-